jgi:hypothetical protein
MQWMFSPQKVVHFKMKNAPLPLRKFCQGAFMLRNALDQGTPHKSAPWILFWGHLFQESSSPQLLTYTSSSIVVVEAPFYFVLLVLILLVQVFVFVLNLHHDFNFSLFFVCFLLFLFAFL